MNLKAQKKSFYRLLHTVYCILVLSVVFCPKNIKADMLDYFDSGENITVVVGEAKSLKVSNPKQIKIGNPSLLDVAGAGPEEVMLDGKKEGETNLTIVDDFGKHSYSVMVLGEDLEKMKERADILLQTGNFKDVFAKIGEKEGKIFVLGRVPSSQKDYFESVIAPIKGSIVDMVKYYDDVHSVEIDVEVLEIEKNALDTLGLEWSKTVSFKEPSGGKFPDEILNPKHFFRILGDWRSDTFTATLNLIKNKGEARTLSRPKIVCLSGKEAKLLVGGQRPIITGSTSTTTSSGSTTDYQVTLKDYGITLSIKPIVKENDELDISITTEISEIDDSQALKLGDTVSTPGFTTRSAQTELTVLSGRTVFIAGLIKSKKTDTRDGIAGVSNIPFLGALFRNKSIDKRDTEVVITLNPTIIRNYPEGLDMAAGSGSRRIGEGKTGPVVMEPVKRFNSEKDPVVDYSLLIQSIINSHLEYPGQLRKSKIKGAVKLSLHLMSNGELLGVLIMESSGNKVLDDTAEYAVKKLSPFPAFNSNIKLKELWIDIPIMFEVK